MTDYGAWLKALLDANPDKTQKALAEYLGWHKSVVTRIKNGDRQVKADERDRIVAFFGAQQAGFSEPPVEYKSAGPAPSPIVTARSLGDGRWRIERSREIGRRAPLVPGAKLFGFHAPDDAAAPRFRTGEFIWVDAARPALVGFDAFVAQDVAGGALDGELGALIAQDATHVAIRRYSDGVHRRFALKDWKSMFCPMRD